MRTLRLGAFNRAGIFQLILAILVATVPASTSCGQEIETRYARIIYDSEAQITKFNSMSLRSLSRHLRSAEMTTPQDEAGEKLDVVVERVRTLLHLFQPDLKFWVVLLATAEEVQNVYESRYGTAGVQYVAFYSPLERTLFTSVDDIDLDVLAHELTHVIVDQYFHQHPTAAIHEAVAQYVVSHIDEERPDRIGACQLQKRSAVNQRTPNFGCKITNQQPCLESDTT